jgi:hypothetical protein
LNIIKTAATMTVEPLNLLRIFYRTSAACFSLSRIPNEENLVLVNIDGLFCSAAVCAVEDGVVEIRAGNYVQLGSLQDAQPAISMIQTLLSGQQVLQVRFC